MVPWNLCCGGSLSGHRGDVPVCSRSLEERMFDVATFPWRDALQIVDTPVATESDTTEVPRFRTPMSFPYVQVRR